MSATTTPPSRNTGARIRRAITRPSRIPAYLLWQLRTWSEEWSESRMQARCDRALSRWTPQEVREERESYISRATGESITSVQAWVQEVEDDRAFLEHVEGCRLELTRQKIAGNSPQEDCITLYALVRALRPREVVETGMYFGASASFILRAMEQNGLGTLHSIDLPSEAGGPYGSPYGLGCMVPSDLRQRWQVHWGDAKEILPHLLDELVEIDMFFHDSVHTDDFMIWEYETAWPAVRAGGMLCSHDVWRNRVFPDFVSRHCETVSDSARICNVGAIRKSSMIGTASP